MNETQIPINYKILLAEDDHDMRRFLRQGAAECGLDCPLSTTLVRLSQIARRSRLNCS